MERTAKARAGRVESLVHQKRMRQDARIAVLQWLAWFGYSTSNILTYLVKRSPRLLTEMCADGLIHLERHLMKGGRRKTRHGAQFTIVTTMHLTKAGHRLTGLTNAGQPVADVLSLPFRRHLDRPEIVRHNLLVQISALHLLESHDRRPDFQAFTPETQRHAPGGKLYGRNKPDGHIDIAIDDGFPEQLYDDLIPKRSPLYGTYFIEVERSRKRPKEMVTFRDKLKKLVEFGKPVIVTEKQGAMTALLARFAEHASLDVAEAPGYLDDEDGEEETLQYEANFALEKAHEEEDPEAAKAYKAKALKILAKIKNMKEARTLQTADGSGPKLSEQMEFIVLTEECPHLVELLP